MVSYVSTKKAGTYIPGDKTTTRSVVDDVDEGSRLRWPTVVVVVGDDVEREKK